MQDAREGGDVERVLGQTRRRDVADLVADAILTRGRTFDAVWRDVDPDELEAEDLKPAGERACAASEIDAALALPRLDRKSVV